MQAPYSVTHDGSVAWLTLRRPEKNNAFDDELIRALAHVLRDLAEDPGTTALVLSGEGRNFCAGGDLAWMRRAASYGPEDNLADATNLALLMHRLDRFPKPTVAKVQGAAYGGGVGLVACCDVAVAAADATFCLSEVRLGLIPAVISPYVVATIGARAARRYFQTAETFDAQEARHIGLVHEVVPNGELDTRVGAFLAYLKRGGPEAKASAKALVREVTQLDDDAVIEHTARLIAELRARPEAREGITAFLDRRQPAWA